eukprot:4236849-Pleurochrysis_carterae.AAC.1
MRAVVRAVMRAVVRARACARARVGVGTHHAQMSRTSCPCVGKGNDLTRCCFVKSERMDWS